MQVQVQLAGPLDRAPRPWERLCGPLRHGLWLVGRPGRERAPLYRTQ